MFDDIEKAIKESIAFKVKQVIHSQLDSVDLYFVPIKDIEIILESLGVQIKSITNYKTDGWMVDFYYTYDNKYVLSGNLHYGNFKFSTVDFFFKQ